MRFDRGRIATVTTAVSAAVVVLWLAATPVPADEPAEGVFTGTLDVRVLNLDVVVTDRDGRRVPDLKQADFSLFVDGEPVAIEYFTEVRDGKFVAAVPDFDVAPGAEAGTSFLVFVDEFFSLSRDKNQVLEALKERAPNLGPADRVSVVCWNGKSLDVLAEWAGSAPEVDAALAEAIDRPGLALQREQERRQYSVRLHPDDIAESTFGYASPFDRHRLGTQERLYASLLVDQLKATVGAANAAMRSLDRPSGRKALVLLAGGWPMNVDDWVGRAAGRGVYEPGIPSPADLYGPLAATANLLGYSIYGVDMPGFMQTAGTDVSLSEPLASGYPSAQFFMEGELHNTLQYLASETGGLPMINAERITAMDEAGKDVDNYYWLGFSPQWLRDDSTHDIRVEVSRPDLLVRTRTGYQDISDASQIAMAVRSALLYGTFRPSAELGLEVGEVAKAGRGKFEVTVKMSIPFSALTVLKTPDGYRTTAILFMVALDSGGGTAEMDPIPLVATTAEEPGPNHRISHEVKLLLRKKTERLSVALYDPVGGKTYTNSLNKGDGK